LGLEGKLLRDCKSGGIFPGKQVISPHKAAINQSLCQHTMTSQTQNSGQSSGLPGKTRVLMIDDDKKLCRLVRDYLEPMGYEVETVHTGPEGLEKALKQSFHAVILDLMLPGMDGFEVLKKLRHTSDVPVLMLTGRGEEPDRIVGLEIGADDYLPKTFSTRELLARLRAVTRRSSHKQANAPDVVEEIVVGPLRVRPASRVALLDNQPMVLTPVEFDMLSCLAQAKGRVKTREQLLDSISDRNYDVFDRSIDVHISALRKKLGDDPKNPRFIKTLRVAGYMLIDPESDF
jgi:DNA-binding response OmpR family regulator